MTNVIEGFRSVPAESWHQLWVILASSTVVAVVLQAIKHWFSLGERKKTVTILLSVLSALASFVDWLVQNISQNPLLFGRYTATVLGTAVVVHRFFVSPLYHKVVVSVSSLLADAQIERNRRNAAAQAAASASQPQPQEFTL